MLFELNICWGRFEVRLGGYDCYEPQYYNEFAVIV